ERTGIAGMKRAVAQCLCSRFRVVQISLEQRAFDGRPHNDLTFLTVSHRLSCFVEKLDREPRHWLADSTDCSVIVAGGDAGGFSHAVAFAHFHPEAVAEK